MSEAQNSKDQSMEEILQSIKRIIADEEGVPQAEPASVEDELVVKGSDVLELKDMVEPSPADHLASILAQPAAQNSSNEGILGAIDAHYAESAPVHDTQPTAKQVDEDILASIDSLLDSQTVQASTVALQALKQRGTEAQSAPSSTTGLPLHFRSGTTLEDIVLEALKPELKQWLNANLPSMVERMVAAEIKKITS